MATRLFSGEPGLARLVEKQMRNWELARSQRLTVPAAERKEVEDFVCVSRQVGVDDKSVATRLGKRLQWPVFDREILDTMAGDDDMRRQIYQSMDERDLSWWEETLRSLAQEEFVRNDYFHRLCQTLLSLARQSCCVFLGRGADLILPETSGFRVRLVAPSELRIERYAEQRELTKEVARREVARRERERSRFLRRHFGVEANDPLRTDVVINLARFTIDQAVEVVLQTRRIYLGETATPATVGA
jgi:cytidylate kinase